MPTNAFPWFHSYRQAVFPGGHLRGGSTCVEYNTSIQVLCVSWLFLTQKSRETLHRRKFPSFRDPIPSIFYHSWLGTLVFLSGCCRFSWFCLAWWGAVADPPPVLSCWCPVWSHDSRQEVTPTKVCFPCHALASLSILPPTCREGENMFSQITSA